MNISAVDLNLLVVFDALLADGSVTRAARRVGLSQPAFSHALGRLRSAVGDPLFQRTRHGMSPTPRALAMAVPVRAALSDLQRALAAPVVPATAAQVVTIAANQYAQYLLVPSVIKTLSKKAATISLDVRDASALNAADSQEMDLTLDWTFSGSHRLVTEVLRDGLVGIVRKTNSAFGSTVSRATFERLDRIGVHYDPSFRHADAGADSHVMSDALSAMCVVSHTDAIAIVPSRLARQFAAAMGLRVFRLPDQRPDVALEVAWTARVATSEAITTVRNCLVESGARLAGGRRR